MPHTPAPWIICDDLTIRVKEWSNCQQMGDYQGCIICDLLPALSGGDDAEVAKQARAHAWPETEANLHLICAAPDLLTALVDMIAGYEDTMNRYGHAAGDVKAARAAITKAQGK